MNSKRIGPAVANVLPPSHRLFQRKCACGGNPGPSGECEKCRKRRLSFQRKTIGSGHGVQDDSLAPPIVHEVLRSPGQPLDAATRGAMESRFGHDLSRVRIHTDSKAGESARAVLARAYTFGKHVVFARGQDPTIGSAGKELLAHELTHVVQQGNSSDAGSMPIQVAPGESELEREAEQWSRGASKAQAPHVPSQAGPLSLQKAPDETASASPQAATPGAPAQRGDQVANSPAPATGQSPPVFICTKSVAGIGNHAFFRVGGTGAGNSTFELEHDEYGDHCPCGIQGVPTRDYPEDRDSPDSPCVQAPGVTQQCLLSNWNRYPRGKYCALGPNSNTYAHWLASQCGAAGVHPAKWVPGFDDAPPKDGTANPALSAEVTLLPGGCGTIDCDDTSCHFTGS